MILITVLSCLFTSNSYAQIGSNNQKPTPCPTMQFVTPPYEVEAGKPVTLTIKVTGGDPNADYTYNWMVSDGAISSGQGTVKIEIDTAEAKGVKIMATVEVGSVAPECQMSRFHTIMIKKNSSAL
jgi:hypothetical protein